MTIINGKLALTDPDDAVGDNGEYQCRAGNKFGEILSNTVIVSFGCKWFHVFWESNEF